MNSVSSEDRRNAANFRQRGEDVHGTDNDSIQGEDEVQQEANNGRASEEGSTDEESSSATPPPPQGQQRRKRGTYKKFRENGEKIDKRFFVRGPNNGNQRTYVSYRHILPGNDEYPNGVYFIGPDETEYPKLFGNREEVFYGYAYKTKAEKFQQNFQRNKWGKIVSINKSVTTKREMPLLRCGYAWIPGRFIPRGAKITLPTTKKRIRTMYGTCRAGNYRNTADEQDVPEMPIQELQKFNVPEVSAADSAYVPSNKTESDEILSGHTIDYSSDKTSQLSKNKKYRKQTRNRKNRENNGNVYRNQRQRDLDYTAKLRPGQNPLRPIRRRRRLAPRNPQNEIGDFQVPPGADLDVDGYSFDNTGENDSESSNAETDGSEDKEGSEEGSGEDSEEEQKAASEDNDNPSSALYRPPSNQKNQKTRTSNRKEKESSLSSLSSTKSSKKKQKENSLLEALDQLDEKGDDDFNLYDYVTKLPSNNSDQNKANQNQADQNHQNQADQNHQNQADQNHQNQADQNQQNQADQNQARNQGTRKLTTNSTKKGESAATIPRTSRRQRGLPPTSSSVVTRIATKPVQKGGRRRKRKTKKRARSI